MSAPVVDVMAARAAAVSGRQFVRGMGWILIELARMVPVAGAWMVTFREGKVDATNPLVYRAGPGMPETGLPAKPQIGGLRLDRLAPELSGRDLCLTADDREGPELPLAGWMKDRGLVTGMLLACRHEEEPVALLGLIRRSGGAGFPSGVEEAVAPLGAPVAHALSAIRELGERNPRGLAGERAPLTGREAEVAMLVAGGATGPEVAATLGVSTGTVKSHLHRVYAKLGVKSRTELALLLDETPGDPV